MRHALRAPPGGLPAKRASRQQPSTCQATPVASHQILPGFAWFWSFTMTPTPSSSDGGKKKQKRKHVTLSISDKLKLIKRVERGESRKKIMQDFNIGSSTVSDIMRVKANLMKFAGSGQSMRGADSRKTMKKPKLEELDEVVWTWFKARRAEGKPMSGQFIIEKAKKFCEEMEIETDVKFSDGWLRNFKHRHGIRAIDVAGEKQSADEEAAAAYSELFSQLIREHKLTPDQVFNADETGLYWRCLPTRTLVGRDEKGAAGHKMNKERVTLLLCANAAGTYRCQLLLIGKYKKPRAFKNLKTKLPVIYEAQANAWMSAELFKKWFFSHFVPEVMEFFKSKTEDSDSPLPLLEDSE